MELSFLYKKFDKACTEKPLKNIQQILNDRVESIYYGACDEFGVKNHATILTEIHTEMFGYLGRTLFFGKDLWHVTTIIVRVPVAACRIRTRETFYDTIPHEIAHAVVQQMYPERPNIGHGELWQEMAKYLGARPIATVHAEESEIELLKNHKEFCHANS